MISRLRLFRLLEQNINWVDDEQQELLAVLEVEKCKTKELNKLNTS